jgi:transposase
MARGKRISKDLRQTIINLLHSHSHQEVAEQAEVSPASVYRIAREMATTGGFPPPKRRRKGQFKALTELQFQVRHNIPLPGLLLI